MAKHHEQEQQGNSGCPDHLLPYQYKPGTSGNPGGRPVGSGFQAAILRQLAEIDESTGKRVVDSIAEKLIELCRGGEIKALELMLKRIWPALPQGEEDGGTIVVVRDFTRGRNGRQPHEAILREEARGQAEADDEPLN
jgi:hypothetical protein